MFPRRFISLGLTSLAAIAALPAYAGADKVAFPENWDKGVLYGTVDRHDIKQYRELYSTKPAVDAVKAGKPIPSGTVLTLVQYKAKVDDKGNVVKGADGKFQKGDLVAYTVMEKRAGWGARSTRTTSATASGNIRYSPPTRNRTRKPISTAASSATSRTRNRIS